MYQVFDHTADLGLRVEANTREELFVDAARGFYSVLVANPESIKPVLTKNLRIDGTQNDYLLFDWLTELLFAFDTERLLITEFDLKFDGHGLTAVTRGESIDVARHVLEHEIKAITYHGLKVEQLGYRWLAEVIVDI